MAGMRRGPLRPPSRSAAMPSRSRLRQAGVVATIGFLVINPSVSAMQIDTTVEALTAGPGQMAEAAVAVDPANSRHLAAAADPYLDPVRIQATTSEDGGASWSLPITVIPDGFTKSFDPVLRFGASGELIVAGGASGTGGRHCQPRSAVFVAVIDRAGPTYRLVRDARADGAHIDRPGLAVDVARGRAYVTWTEWAGDVAGCQATPTRSTTRISTSRPDGSFTPPRALPTTGLSAPFGSTPAVGPDGTLVVAVAEHEVNHSRVVVTTSSDEAATFSRPEIVIDESSVPIVAAGVGGLVATVPALALGPGGQKAVAFVAPGPGGVAPIVLEQLTGSPWTVISPAVLRRPELLPQVAYGRQGRLWLLSANAGDGAIDFMLRRRVADVWSPPVLVGRGPSGGYVELGESLGLTVVDDAAVTSVPIDGPSISTLVVGVHREPVEDPSTSVPAPTPAGPEPSSRPDVASTRTPRRRADAWAPDVVGLAALGVLAMTGLGVAVRLASHRQRRRRRRPD